MGGSAVGKFFNDAFARARRRRAKAVDPDGVTSLDEYRRTMNALRAATARTADTAG